MKNKIIFLSLLFAMLFTSCNGSLSPKMEVKKDSANAENLEANLPLSVENSSLITSIIPEKPENAVDNYFIVKTDDNFEPSLFTEQGFEIRGKLPLMGKNIVFWYLYNEDTKSFSKLIHIPGVRSTDWEYSVEAPKYYVGRSKQNDDFKISARGILDGDLDDVDAAVGYSMYNTKAVDAYKDNNIGYGPNTVVAGIIDTGTNMMHKDLKDVVLYAKSCATGAYGNFIGDQQPFKEIPLGENWDINSGHGTHCSGTICAKGENAESGSSPFKGGINGVAWKQTKLISYQGLGNAGGGKSWSIYGALIDLTNIVNILRIPPSTRSQEQIKALPSYLQAKHLSIYITQKTVPVNMSLGGSYGAEFSLYAVSYALENNILPVIAMGNEGAFTNSYPAAFPGVLAVGAVDGKDKQARFSTRGSWISICAPGVGIESCHNFRNDGTQNMSGTSMATPFVTGTIAYLLSFDGARKLTPYQIKALLENTADKIDGATEWTDKYGHGRVNVYEAAKAIKHAENDTLFPDAKEIPKENSVYSEFEIRITAKNNGAPIPTPKILILEKDSNTPVLTLGGYNNEPITIKGLKIGKEYSLVANFADSVKTAEITPGTQDQDVELNFDANIAWFSTVPNLAYNGGKDKTDTVLTIYEAKDDGSFDEKNIADHYDAGYLDTFYFKYTKGKKYYISVDGFTDEEGIFRGGNYVVSFGDALLNPDGENVKDGERTAKDNDSHDTPDPDTPESAKERGNFWGKTFGGNLVTLGKDSSGKDIPDTDWFYIEVPTE